MLQDWRSVSDFRPHSSKFDPKTFRPCEICGVQSGTVTVFSPSTAVYPVNIIPPVFHAVLHLRVGRTRTNGRGLGTFQKHWCFKNRGGGGVGQQSGLE